MIYTIEELKEMELEKLKAIAFDLLQEKDNIINSIQIVLNILREKQLKT